VLMSYVVQYDTAQQLQDDTARQEQHGSIVSVLLVYQVSKISTALHVIFESST
jgi:hypothetical protein